jgi:hypothetical protein
MQDLIWDAVPAQRKRKEESFSAPTMTLSAIAKVGAGRKFSFNKAAQVALGIDGGNRVSFGFTPDGAHIFIRKVVDENVGFALTQSCTISDKKTYEFIAKRLELNTEVENHFDIMPLEGYSELVLRTAVAEEVLEFNTTDLGEVSDGSDFDADLSRIPEVPQGGALYEMADTTTEVPDSILEEVLEEDEDEDEDEEIEELEEEESDEEVW